MSKTEFDAALFPEMLLLFERSKLCTGAQCVHGWCYSDCFLERMGETWL